MLESRIPQADFEKERRELYAKIGEPEMQRDWCNEKLEIQQNQDNTVVTKNAAREITENAAFLFTVYRWFTNEKNESIKNLRELFLLKTPLRGYKE